MAMQTRPDVTPAQSSPFSFTPTRRQVIAAGLSVAGLAAAGMAMGSGARLRRDDPKPAPGDAAAPKPGGKKSILILGGTGFLGPALLDAARARGHSVTLFNRGKTEKRKPGQFDDVEKLYGNRDPNLRADDADPDSPKGLSALEGKKWDAAIDTSGYVPRVVKASAELLRDNIKQYVFISTISVYAGNATPNQAEDADLGKMEDESIESMGAQSENYGPLKALCEKAAEAAMPGRVLNVRPGFIVGPGDPTDRFTYWPVRASRPEGYAEQMLVPGDGSEPVQFIDVRDLAEWIVLCIERGTNGVFNATGPDKPLPFRILIDACQEAAGNQAKPVWVPLRNLQEQSVAIGMELPIWIPPEGPYAGFHSRNCAKAIAAGLKFRTPLDTCKATLAWWPSEVERRVRVTRQMIEDAKNAGKTPPQMADPLKMRAGLSPEREAAVLTAFNARQADDAKAEQPKP